MTLCSGHILGASLLPCERVATDENTANLPLCEDCARMVRLASMADHKPANEPPRRWVAAAWLLWALLAAGLALAVTHDNTVTADADDHTEADDAFSGE